MADEGEGLWPGKKVEMWFRLTGAAFVHSVFVQPLHLVLCLVFSTPATGRISIGNLLSWDVLFAPLSSYREVLRAPIIALIVSAAFPCQNQVIL